jgi:hypothetical protein
MYKLSHNVNIIVLSTITESFPLWIKHDRTSFYTNIITNSVRSSCFKEFINSIADSYPENKYMYMLLYCIRLRIAKLFNVYKALLIVFYEVSVSNVLIWLLGYNLASNCRLARFWPRTKISQNLALVCQNILTSCQWESRFQIINLHT